MPNTYCAVDVFKLGLQPGHVGYHQPSGSGRETLTKTLEEMATIFHRQRKFGHLSLYVRKVDPTRTPQVVAGLLDAGCEAPTVAELIAHIDNATLATGTPLWRRG